MKGGVRKVKRYSRRGGAAVAGSGDVAANEATKAEGINEIKRVRQDE